MTVGFAFASTVWGQQSEGPTPDEILDDCLEAFGGEMSLDISGATIEGTLTGEMRLGTDVAPDMELKGTIRVLFKTGKMAVAITHTSMGDVTSTVGFDGETYWQSDAEGSKRVADEEVAGWVQAIAYLPHQILYWRDENIKFSKQEDCQFADRPAYQLELEVTGESRSTQYFDKETGLLLGSAFDSGDQKATCVYQYDEIDGVQCIKNIEITGEGDSIGFKYTFELTEQEFDTEIDDDVFAGPEK
jgi:outer membrane lipoprotein-sorting protein